RCAVRGNEKTTIPFNRQKKRQRLSASAWPKTRRIFGGSPTTQQNAALTHHARSKLAPRIISGRHNALKLCRGPRLHQNTITGALPQRGKSERRTRTQKAQQKRTP